ncbi:MAG: SpoIIE family protein phosphatase [Phycisphaerales bacterium]|nr:SpoIIE family protein phosphatase [Phycisphaerales bacterium]
MPQAHVHVILADTSIPEILARALRRIRATASFRLLSEVLRSAASPVADAYVIVVAPDHEIPPARLRVLLDRIADEPRSVMIFREGGGFLRRIARPPTVPVCFFGGNEESELAIRLEMMLEVRESLSTLHREGIENRSAESRAVQGYQAQLRLASQVQREFLPDNPPPIGAASFSVFYRPADFVSGDIYDIQQLDNEHVGIAIADATGHGIPAALLTVFVKRALRGTERAGGSKRLLAPTEVLTRLNHDLLEANLRQCQFVAAAYAILNTRTLELEIARAGTPFPVLRRASGATECLRCDGGVVGIMPDAKFTPRRVQLAAGDSVLLFSDGLDRLVMPPTDSDSSFAPHAARRAKRTLTHTKNGFLTVAQSAERNGKFESGTATAVLEQPITTAIPAGDAPADETLAGSPWLDVLACDGVEIALDALATRHDALRRLGAALDDVTVLAIRIAD